MVGRLLSFWEGNFSGFRGYVSFREGNTFKLGDQFSSWPWCCLGGGFNPAWSIFIYEQIGETWFSIWTNLFFTNQPQNEFKTWSSHAAILDTQKTSRENPRPAHQRPASLIPSLWCVLESSSSQQRCIFWGPESTGLIAIPETNKASDCPWKSENGIDVPGI